MASSAAWTVLPAVAAIDYSGYLFWCMIVAVGVALLGVALMMLRRRMRSRGVGAEFESGFSIEALEAMRCDGQIDEAEFKALRRAALGLDAGGDSVDNAVSSEGGDGVDE